MPVTSKSSCTGHGQHDGEIEREAVGNVLFERSDGQGLGLAAHDGVGVGAVVECQGLKGLEGHAVVADASQLFAQG